MEAITSRPLLLHAIATRVRHARQTTITVASSHARAIPAAKALRAVAIFLRELAKTAEQLTGLQRWRQILARAFQVFLRAVSCVRPHASRAADPQPLVEKARDQPTIQRQLPFLGSIISGHDELLLVAPRRLGRRGHAPARNAARHLPIWKLQPDRPSVGTRLSVK